MRALQRALTGIFADTSSCSLSEKDKEEDEPPACERTECGVELPKLHLFFFALNLSSSSLSSSAPRNSHGSTCLFARAMRLRMGGASAARAQLWRERGASRHAHALHRPLRQLQAAFQVPCAGHASGHPNLSANKTTQKARGRPRRGRKWAARPRQTRAPVCASRRAQCGARERPCRAAPALAVPT